MPVREKSIPEVTDDKNKGMSFCRKFLECEGKETKDHCLRYEDRRTENAEVKMVNVDFKKKIDSIRPKEDMDGGV